MKTKLILTRFVLICCSASSLFGMRSAAEIARDTLKKAAPFRAAAQDIRKTRAEEAIKKHRESPIVFERSAVAHEESFDDADVVEAEEAPSTFAAIVSWLMCTIGVGGAAWLGTGIIGNWVISKNKK